MPPKVGQRAHVSDTKPAGRMAPNTPVQPPRPTTPDASTQPADTPTVRAAKAGPTKAADDFRAKEMPTSQRQANPVRATISDLNDPDRDD